MNKLLVSVIVPIYNIADYLPECLNSLERQTLKDIEVILVNDGSTDNSEDIARTYAQKNANFKLVSRVNGGLSAARNTGLDIAQGEYVYFLDSDDYLENDAIEKLYKKAESECLDQLRFCAYTFDDGTTDYRWTRESREEGGYKYLGSYPSVTNGVDFYQKAIENGDYYPSCCLILTRRSVIEENSLRFYEGILHEDNLFNFQLTTLCKRVAVLNEPLYYRRNRKGSITQSFDWLKRNRSMCISAIEADKFIEDHFHGKGIVANWQMNFFINSMLWQWEQMSKDNQDSKESKKYFAMIKPLIKKYVTGRSRIDFMLFYISYPLYRVYRRGRLTVGRVFH